jgi:antitoxin component of RelBE/YafQ-DinJ toxin-antitoxin module
MPDSDRIRVGNAENLTPKTFSSIFVPMKTTRESSVLVRARVPAKRLRNAEKILARLGMKPGDAINLLLAQVELRRGLPFSVSLDDAPLVPGERQGAEWAEAFGAY